MEEIGSRLAHHDAGSSRFLDNRHKTYGSQIPYLPPFPRLGNKGEDTLRPNPGEVKGGIREGEGDEGEGSGQEEEEGDGGGE